ncbi:MAG: glycoside hydrolase family 9 protein, partial [Parcubacteria group bacterium]|nr:glycoside hydrolase family 9 protein [Parcubacteria group bacterium]
MLAEKIVKIRLKTLTKLITAVALGGVGLIFPQNSISQGQTFLLWDGETVGTVFHYGGPTVSAYAGSAAFEGIPDQWHEPGIGLNNLPTWRQDISNYDEIWFYAKADAPGKTFDFSIYGWPYFSKKINIDPYIVGGGGLTTSYKQIRIPITLLKTNEYPLDRVEIFYFGTANPPASNHKIYIDNVYAVRFNQAPPPPNPEPLPPPLPQPIPIPPLPPPQLIPQPPPTQVFTGQFQTIIKAPNSSSLTVNWPDQSEASEFRVYLGPEPSADNINGVLPNQVLVATLPAGTTSYTIAKLAAGVDVFTHIEAITPTGTKFSNSYNKTLGGPRSKLDTALREVHLAAPNIIELILENKSTGLNGLALIGNLGGLWQTGPWSIKRSDGADIAVAKIFRHSIPVSQPDYRVGFGLPYNENVVDVDHKIYLVLAEPIGQKEVLTITGPQNLIFILPFSDRYLETPAIQLNQVGYNPRASKRWAYVSGWLGDGGALKLADFPNMAHVLAESSNPLQTRQEVVRNLPITPRSILDADSGTQVKEINLSAVPASEDTAYRIHIPGVGVSWPTTISEKATREIFYTVARGLFHNRWAGDLKPSYTKWSRPQDHTTVFTAENTNLREFFPETTPKTGQRSLLGGYHDAGDFDQQLMHTVVPQALMRAFESNPAAFADNTLNIPESGNGIPDILDEALWGIAAWEQLQEADGGVRAGVESSRHPLGYYYAHQDQLQYWTYSTEPYHTARVAGLFAQAARLLAPYNSSRAEALKTRAIKAYFFSMAKGAPFNPSLLYAASELFALTRQLIYKSTFERVWSGMGVYGAFSNFSPYQFYLGDYFNNDRIMTDHLLGYLRQSSADAAI